MTRDSNRAARRSGATIERPAVPSTVDVGAPAISDVDETAIQDMMSASNATPAFVPVPNPAALDVPSDTPLQPADSILPAPTVVAPALTFEQARLRMLDVLAAMKTGAAIDMDAAAIARLALALENPPKVTAAARTWDGTHHSLCGAYGPCACAKVATIALPNAVLKVLAQADAIYADVRAGRVPSVVTQVGRSASTGTRGTPVSTVPAGMSAVTYKGEGMRYSVAATKAAADFPTATECQKYVAGIAKHQSLNAQIPLRKDVAAGRIPAGVITFAADPVGATA